MHYRLNNWKPTSVESLHFIRCSCALANKTNKQASVCARTFNMHTQGDTRNASARHNHLSPQMWQHESFCLLSRNSPSKSGRKQERYTWTDYNLLSSPHWQQKQKATALCRCALAKQMWLQVVTVRCLFNPGANSRRSLRAINSWNNIPNTIWQTLFACMLYKMSAHLCDGASVGIKLAGLVSPLFIGLLYIRL